MNKKGLLHGFNVILFGVKVDREDTVVAVDECKD